MKYKICGFLLVCISISFNFIWNKLFRFYHGELAVKQLEDDRMVYSFATNFSPFINNIIITMFIGGILIFLYSFKDKIIKIIREKREE